MARARPPAKYIGPTARSCGPGAADCGESGYPGQASASQDRMSGLPGLPSGPVTCGLLAGGWAGAAVRATLDVLAPVQPARMAQVSAAKVSVRING